MALSCHCPTEVPPYRHRMDCGYYVEDDKLVLNPYDPDVQCCSTVIPGIGTCELKVGEHKLDGRGWPIHKLGPIQWNGVAE